MTACSSGLSHYKNRMGVRAVSTRNATRAGDKTIVNHDLSMGVVGRKSSTIRL